MIARLCMCIPVFEDWASATVVLRRLDEALGAVGRSCDVLLVDDGSFSAAPEAVALSGGGVRRVEILHLRRNLGHQRAIAVGLAFICRRGSADAVVVMDGDGEDRPEDVPRLLARFEEVEGRAAVFARRGRRSEGLLFRGLYVAYRLLHWLLTGLRVEVGNFSVISASVLGRLVAHPELWNHYAACVVASRTPRELVTIDRGVRVTGCSRMNLTSLVVHGLSAITVYSELVGVRLLVVGAGLFSLAGLGLIGVVAVRLLTTWAIPGWATSAGGALMLGMYLSVVLMLGFVFVTLQRRDALGFLPVRDYRYFVARVGGMGLTR